LKAAVGGENHEHQIMYPEFAKTAEEEGFSKIAGVFRAIAKAEVGHEVRFKKFIGNIEQGKVFKRDQKVTWRCRNCGYLHESTGAPDRCPACDHPQSFYEIMGENY